MLNLFRSNNLNVESAYISTVKGNEASEWQSKRCATSCETVGMPYKIWDAYNGLSGNIIPPAGKENDDFMDMLKITDHYMTRGEVACALSHISLWKHCAVIDRPIVVLEHDSIMVKKFTVHDNYNSIIYLGGAEWAKNGWPMTPVPPMASDGPNYLFICRAHAYSIDPHVAKNLLSHVLKMGLCAPLDIMIRSDLFCVTHKGFYAYDDNVNLTNDTTIKGRPLEGRATKRNSKLEW